MTHEALNMGHQSQKSLKIDLQEDLNMRENISKICKRKSVLPKVLSIMGNKSDRK